MFGWFSTLFFQWGLTLLGYKYYPMSLRTHNAVSLERENLLAKLFYTKKKTILCFTFAS